MLDDGTTQLRQYSYDNGGAFKLTQSTDPLGRVSRWSYPNHIDLAAVTQNAAYGFTDTLAQITYNTHHRPILATGADGRTTQFAYNAAGQLASVTNALGKQTQFLRNATGDLTSVVNANGVTAATYTYDGFDRIATFTDSEGWTVAYGYDAADRLTSVTYPDGTAERYTYQNLDPSSYTDRGGRTWLYSYDADRRLISSTDPLGQQLVYGYDASGRRTSLKDPKNNTTTWAYDLEGRLTTKTYPDNSTRTIAYEATASRVHTLTDALGQVKQYAYAVDDRLVGVTYLNAVKPTPNVALTWDPYYPRPLAMTDGSGTTNYTYVAIGSDGALRRRQENLPLAGGVVITYGYDALGRLASRSVGGAGAESFGYDALGRLTSHGSDLGAFTIAYLGQTSQPTSRTLSSSTVSTSWSYLANSGDRRLAGITNTGLVSGQTDTYQYTTVPGAQITVITETSDQAFTNPPVTSQSAAYNTLNQLTTLAGQTISYDADGNLLSDGARTYSWDAENRLVGISYAAAPGQQTTFTYDGMGRRIAIGRTPAGGGSTVTTSYVYCGAVPCQARNTSNLVTREYAVEGEFVPGSPAQPLYYGKDQVGSVRRVFATSSNAPAYRYDPFGNALQSTARLTDYGYAGLFSAGDSGLFLAAARAYSPVAGRWLSRDPLGEASDPVANLYTYVGNAPVNTSDPSGQFGVVGAAVGGAVFGAADLGYQLYNNGARFGCVDWSEVGSSAALGAVLGSGVGAADAAVAGWVEASVGETTVAAAEETVTAESIIAPEGNLIGTPNPGSPGDVRNLPGGDQAAQDLFGQLNGLGTPGNKPGYPGPTVDLPNGGFAGYRSGAGSSSGVPAVDVNIPGTYTGKFHFP